MCSSINAGALIQWSVLHYQWIKAEYSQINILFIVHQFLIFIFIFFCVMSRVEWWENRSFWASEIRILLEFRAHILHRGVMHICTCGSKYCNLIFRATLIFLMQLLLPLKLKKMCFSKWSQDCLHYHCWYFGFWNDIIELFFLCLSAIQILFALLFQTF